MPVFHYSTRTGWSPSAIIETGSLPADSRQAMFLATDQTAQCETMAEESPWIT